MVIHRLQADILMQDEAAAKVLYSQIASLAPRFAAIGKEKMLFEPSSLSIQGSYEDEEHQGELSISDPKVAQEVYDFLASRHPELVDIERPFAASFVQLHDCYHDENPPRPCVISERYEITAEEAVAKALPVAGSVVCDTKGITVIDGTFEAKVTAKRAEILAAAEAKRLAAEAVSEDVLEVVKG